MFQVQSGGAERKIRVALYARVSTDEQSRDGFGVDMQVDSFVESLAYKAKAAHWHHDPKWRYIDHGYSGADLNRPAYRRLIEDAKKGVFDIVVVWKVDRLSRNLTHLLSAFETLQEHRVSFCSLKENIDFTGPIGKLTFQIFGALAEFERETIKMRTKEGKMASARLGNYVANSPPFGYRKIKSETKTGRGLEIVPNEAEIVKYVFSKFLEGSSLGGIASELTELGTLKSTHGLRKAKYTKWYGTTVRDILGNAAYTGRAVHRSHNEDGTIVEIPVPVPRIVSDLEFEMAARRLDRIAYESKRGGGKEYLLSRKIFDKDNGRTFVAYSRVKGGHGYRRKSFELNGVRYPNKEIPGEALDQLIWGAIEKMVNRPESLFEVYERQALDNTQYGELLENRDRLAVKLRESESEEMTVEAEFFRGLLSEEKKDVHCNRIRETIRKLELQIAEYDTRIDAIVSSAEIRKSLNSFVEGFNSKMENIDFSQKRALVELLVERIDVSWEGKRLIVNPIFRFDQSKLVSEERVIEPKKGSPKPQSDNEEPDSESNGATSRARTCDLDLRRVAL